MNRMKEEDDPERKHLTKYMEKNPKRKPYSPYTRIQN